MKISTESWHYRIVRDILGEQEGNGGILLYGLKVVYSLALTRLRAILGVFPDLEFERPETKAPPLEWKQWGHTKKAFYEDRVVALIQPGYSGGVLLKYKENYIYDDNGEWETENEAKRLVERLWAGEV